MADTERSSECSCRPEGGLSAHGNVVTATQQAYGAMYQTLVRQAMLLAYIDNFRLLALLCLICMPAGFLFKKVRTRAGPTAMH